MKTIIIQNVLTKYKVGEDVELTGWIRSERCHGGILFVDLVDFSGSIQIIVRKDVLGSKAFDDASRVPPESSVKIRGRLTLHPKTKEKQITCAEIEVLGFATLDLSPRPRSKFDIFAPRYTNLILAKRHLFLRNEKLMAVMQFRHVFMQTLREWFHKEGCIEITAPILTQSLLYDENSAFKLDFFGHKVFLTQCVAFYLEAAVHAFGKVYTIGPSFRAEPSRGKRHLAEYWHVKAEIAFADLEDITRFTEKMIFHIADNVKKKATKELEVLGATIDLDRLAPPYPRISYRQAIAKLNSKGFAVEFGKSLSDEEQRVLSLEFETPFFVTGLPAAVEPFPYVVDKSDREITKTADMLAPEGYGELLGTAEKICDPEELFRRFKEKKKASEIERYSWYFELRRYGCVPHSGFGMGAERVIRWMLRLPHVRDAIPFPRIYSREPYP